MGRLKSLDYYLEHLVFPVLAAVAVGFILKWAAGDVAQDALAQSAAGRARQTAAADLATFPGL